MSVTRWAIVTGLLLCFAPVTAAEAAFAPANDFVAAADQLGATGFGSDAKGNSVVAWDQQRALSSTQEVKARRLDASGALGPVIELSPGEVGFQPALAVAASGRAFAVWRVADGFEPSTLKGRWIEPDGSLGPLLTLVVGKAGTDPVEAQAVVDPAGVVTVAWRNQSDSGLEMRRVQPDSTLSAIFEDVSGGSGVNAPQIAALPSGATVAVWRGSGIVANVLPADPSKLGAPFPLSGPVLVGNPQIAIDGAGNGLVAWRQTPVEDTYSVSARRLGPTGAVVGPEFDIDPAAGGFVSLQTNVSADSVGEFMVTWNRQDAEGDDVVYARSVNSAGAFAGPAQPLSSGEVSGSGQQSALLDQGVAPIVWDSTAGPGRITLGRTVNSLALPTGGIVELLGDGQGAVAVASAPAAGVAAFLVEYSTSGSAEAAVIRRFLIPPTCADSAATVVQGAPIGVPISCSGPAIEAAQVLEQPKHGTVAAFDPATLSFKYTPSPRYEGSDSFAYAATNDGGSSGAARVTISVGKDTVKPRIKSLRLQRRVLKKRSAGRRSAGPSFARKPARPSFTFQLTFSEPATPALTLEKALRGVRKGGKCRKPAPPAAAGGKPCRRYRTLGKVAGRAADLTATLPVKAKLARKLAAGGRFRASAVATDPAGNRSEPRRLSFRVTK